jgi:hypothetical protein
MTDKNKEFSKIFTGSVRVLSSEEMKTVGGGSKDPSSGPDNQSGDWKISDTEGFGGN